MNRRNILQLVERQCRRWELVQESRRREQRRPWPVVVVSREFGAQGEALARRLGARTGFAVWDGELVHAVAAETGANETVLRSLDEHRRRAIEDSIEGALLGGAYMNSEYVRRLLRLFHTIAEHGDAILVGRGAEYALPSSAAFRLRVVAPLEDRIRGYAERHGVTEAEARTAVEKGERERRAFVRQSFLRRRIEPSDYDLVVNTASLADFDRLVVVVLDAYEAKFGRRPPEAEAEAGGLPDAETAR